MTRNNSVAGLYSALRVKQHEEDMFHLMYRSVSTEVLGTDKIQRHTEKVFNIGKWSVAYSLYVDIVTRIIPVNCPNVSIKCTPRYAFVMRDRQRSLSNVLNLVFCRKIYWRKYMQGVLRRYWPLEIIEKRRARNAQELWRWMTRSPQTLKRVHKIRKAIVGTLTRTKARNVYIVDGPQSLHELMSNLVYDDQAATVLD